MSVFSGSPLRRSDARDFAREHLRGIFCALCLPESRDGTLDEAGLRHDVDHCIEVLGVGGLYVHGYYANFWLLNSTARKLILEIVLDQVAGRVPVIARCAHASLDESIDLMKHAEAAGADVISLLGPQHGHGSRQMVLDHFAAAAQATSLGISVFNTPQLGYVIPPETIAALAAIPNVVAFKNHVAFEHTMAVRQLVGDEVMVVDPEEDRMLVNMTEHGQQTIFTGANMMYDTGANRPMHDYVDALLAGRTSDGTELFHSLSATREVHRRWVVEPWVADSRCPVAVVKVWSGWNGMTGGDVRQPLPQMTPDDIAAMRHDLAGIDRSVPAAVGP